MFTNRGNAAEAKSFQHRPPDRVFRRHQHAGLALRPRSPCDGKDALDRAHWAWRIFLDPQLVFSVSSANIPEIIRVGPKKRFIV